MTEMDPTGYLLVALGGAVGASLRHLAGLVADERRDLPWGTITVNLVGSLLLGLLAGLPVVGDVAALAAVGLCGALTTFSSLAVQAHDRGRRLGTLTVLLTVLPAVALYTGGLHLGAALG